MKSLIVALVAFASLLFVIPTQDADAFHFRRRRVVVNRVVVAPRRFVASPVVAVRSGFGGVSVRAPFVRVNTGGFVGVNAFRSRAVVVPRFSAYSTGFVPVQSFGVQPVVVPVRGRCSAFFSY